MKRPLICLLLLLLMLSLALPVLATVSTSELNSQTVFATNGSCAVTLSLRLRLDGSEGPIEYPLPAGAREITVNGNPADTRQEDDLRYVTLPITGAGTQDLTIGYRMTDLVEKKENQSLLVLPLLSGFYYPVDRLTFSVALPSPVEGEPVLESGYYQQNIGKLLTFSFDGTTITGQTLTPLKDRETLTLSLPLPEKYFHSNPWNLSLPDVWDLVMILLIALAVAYYLLTLMPKFSRSPRRFAVPDGIHAGDVGTCLTGCGTDLTMLVVSWAQMGYIMIEMDHKDRVTLHKRMEMGNERESYEIRWFKSLFGQRAMVDADSYHYAKLCRKLAVKSPLRPQLYDKRSGNPVIFRGICCIVGLVAGLQMALGMEIAVGGKTLLAILFAILCGIFSYFIQAGGKCLPLREKSSLWTACGCGFLWIALGSLAGDLQQAVPMVIFQFVAGIAAAYGGKRSEMGLRYLLQIRGLRRHMTTGSNFDLQQLQQNNPYYFYELIPYALTLGVDRVFARRFGKMRLPEDSFLQCGTAREMTAAQFASRLRKAVDILNRRQKRLPYEKLRGK